ncbi:aldehyde dehydrogenase family protein [Saccharopolyspora dendranthemae]|uniref:Acyl-CoA reductase-like NAD-dependent aldehyde dehydrogenase n=1 Tax=Saccharopolyspora dendranthemae TaxID=1181886 RepID=A0A561U718_9PSEU|nr:aldehyde dehydrogenase family protein [Saccharopolyspora dendranthemae]TWF95160.1 acyl-CoA reductase-like NAD-dependent aldehyde dehydrogenase [Saccharopolyspora dendranthemae]
MTLRVPEHRTASAVLSRANAAAPEAFDDGVPRNLIDRRWLSVGEQAPQITPVDGTVFTQLPKIDAATAQEAVHAAARAHQSWAQTSYEQRREAVLSAVDAMAQVRDDLALLLAWEIGKPWKLACADVDRCLDGARWYADHTEQMLNQDVEGAPHKRQPLPGPVSNIASWNYPMSVLVHAELVQLLAGNAVIAKTPTQGGAVTLTVAHALMNRAGLPASLLSGDGSALSDPLVRSPEVGALAFVGGRSNGGKIAAQLVDTGKRHMLEQEGLNTWGLWEFSDWDGLSAHLRKGFEYAKQRCTAYPRFVVQRKLVDKFLATYLPVVQSVRFGHPLASEDDEPPALDFGPLISAAKATELEGRVAEALRHGAVPLHHGDRSHGHFLEGQDVSAYAAPVTLLAPPGASRLMHEEPFGPVDTIVVVDTEAELLAQMNASNGALVATIACDDEGFAAELSESVQAFKVGINKPRSRGDRDEAFGGRGASWKGAFVGGQHLVHAVTQGPPGEQLYGNFPGYQRYPQT